MLRFTHYRTGGGILGNVGKETLVELKTSIPYIAWVSNPLPAVGGAEAESLEMALLRGPEVVRGSPRAVTAADYERLALEASPDVARALCQYAGETQGVRAGSVRVVLVPRMPTTEGVVPPEQLALSDRLRTGVQTYLDERRMITVRLYIEAPVYVAVAVSAEVYARPRADRAEVREAAEKALYRFLHPTVGGHEGMGWPFERSLFISDLYSVLQAVPAVEHVGTIRLAVVDDGVQTAVPGGTVTVPPRGVLCSAEHTVEVR
jgi:predicted phage baseplate assembly protein